MSIITKGLIGLEDLATGTGTFNRSTSTGGTTPITKISPINVKSFGAKGDGTTDDTAAIQAAITAAVAAGDILYFPAGTYKIIPATSLAIAGGTAMVAFIMQSNMHLLGAAGATLKLANNLSSNAIPKDLYMFATNQALSNISIMGLTMDMNGANNPINNQGFDFSQIKVSGDSARVDDMRIENNRFLNTPGQSCIVGGQSNTPGITLGTRWIVAHNTFLNNGQATFDHSSVYLWCERADVHDNIFQQDSVPAQAEVVTAIELHGSNSTAHNNIIKGYTQGMYLANNYTSDTVNLVATDNIIQTLSFGIILFNNSGAVTTTKNLKNIIISGNVFTLDDTTYPSSPSQKIAVDIEVGYSTSMVTITNNRAQKTGTTIGSIFAYVAPASTAAVSDIVITGNKINSLGHGAEIRATNTAGLGAMEFSGNTVINAGTQGATTNGIGLFVQATNGIATLTVNRNNFIDERGGGSTFTYGILVQGPGTITDFLVGPQTYKGMTSANYNETGGPTVTNRIGSILPSGTPINWTLAGGITIDTGLSRDAAGVVDVGNGTQGDKSGTLQAAFVKDNAGLSYSKVIASGTSTLTSNATLGATTAQAAITTAASGALTTDSIEWSYATAPSSDESLCIVSAYSTSGNVNFVRANPTAGNRNVTAIVINWRVIR